jgi:hypothetical protein
MTKTKLKQRKNVKKPKSEKPKGAGSAYQQAQGKGSFQPTFPAKK